MNGLWIRSQNKRTLAFVKYIGYDRCDSAEPVITLHSIAGGENCHETDLLAIYETKERALEVLDEIQAWIDELEIDTVIIGTTYINGTVRYLTEAKAKELMRKTVFEMPEK